LIRRDLQTHLPRDPVRRHTRRVRTTRRSTQRLPLECSRESHFVNKLSPSRDAGYRGRWRPRQRTVAHRARAHLLGGGTTGVATRGTSFCAMRISILSVHVRNSPAPCWKTCAGWEFAGAKPRLRWTIRPYSQSERRASYLEACGGCGRADSCIPASAREKTWRRRRALQMMPTMSRCIRESVVRAQIKIKTRTIAWSLPASTGIPRSDGEVAEFSDLNLGRQRYVAGKDQGKDFGDFLVWRRDDVPPTNSRCGRR